MKAEIKRVEKSFDVYQGYFSALEDKVKELCDFEAYLTYIPGDGHLVRNDNTTNVAPLHCLDGKTKTKKLTEEEHKTFCI